LDALPPVFQAPPSLLDLMEYGALCEDAAPGDLKHALALRICQALTVHARIEEEVFYPQVRKVIGDDALMDEALLEHTQAKAMIAHIEAMKPNDAGYDAYVQQLGKLIDQHVLEEREQIFLKARNSALDLRAMTLLLTKRQQQLTKKVAATRAKDATK